jgi:hypothetical protein
MIFALGAGDLFDIHNDGEFEETILGESSIHIRFAIRHITPEEYPSALGSSSTDTMGLS